MKHDRMKHVDAFETTALPDGLGREFAADATCVAVLVESREVADGETAAEPSTERGGAPSGERSRRASVTVFRVGNGYVVECEDESGGTRTVGMGPAQFEAYLERVRGDDEWTVLSIAGGRARARGTRPVDESTVGR